MEATKLGVDEMYCSSCGSIIKQRAKICVKCGVRVSTPPLPGTLSATLANTSGQGPQAVIPGDLTMQPGGKSWRTSVVLAVLVGHWTWPYTYKRDGTKFWIGLGIAFACVVTSIVAAASSIVTTPGPIPGYQTTQIDLATIPWLIAGALGFGLWYWAIHDTTDKTIDWYANY